MMSANYRELFEARYTILNIRSNVSKAIIENEWNAKPKRDRFGLGFATSTPERKSPIVWDVEFSHIECHGKLVPIMWQSLSTGNAGTDEPTNTTRRCRTRWIKPKSNCGECPRTGTLDTVHFVRSRDDLWSRQIGIKPEACPTSEDYEQRAGTSDDEEYYKESFEI